VPDIRKLATGMVSAWLSAAFALLPLATGGPACVLLVAGAYSPRKTHPSGPVSVSEQPASLINTACRSGTLPAEEFSWVS